MFRTPLTLMALASLTIVTWSDAQSDLPPLADQADPTPTPAPVPAATPAPIPLPTAAPVPGKWLTNEDEAKNQATQQGKVILVDFDADWCSWCTKMHGEVLSRDTFKEFAAANLILLRMDYPMPESRRSPAAVALLNRCNVTMFPTLLLMKSDGEEIARYKGYAVESVIVQWLRTNVAGGEAAHSIPNNQRLAKHEEAANSPGGRQVDQMQAIITAMANYDWRALEPYFIDGQTNYFGHRHVSVQYVINDIMNDSRQFGRQDWTVYWNTFKHENDGDIAYDSVNAYVVIEEPGVRTHRALEHLTIGYSWDPHAVHGIIIHSVTLKVLHS
jgi:thiol-disulfide isomerase/thioredoxin